jgi:uncharacterized protein (TIGR00730 family)
VFGSSEPLPGEEPYESARKVGGLLASRGLTVVNGGYGGVMEAASRGAREAGGEALGITTDALDGRSSANPYLTEEVREPDLFLRTRTLVERSNGFIVLPGRSGTLAELAFLWALSRADLLGPRPVVLLGAGWPELLESLQTLGILNGEPLRVSRYAAGEAEAVNLVALGLESFERFCKGESGA